MKFTITISHDGNIINCHMNNVLHFTTKMELYAFVKNTCLAI